VKLGFRCECEMSSNAARKLHLLRTEGRAQNHDAGLDQEWPGDIDIKKINKGIKFFSDNFFSMFVNMLTGLLSLMYVEGIARVLHITNRSSTAPLSFSRYLSTLNHTLSWYRGVPEMLKSAARVRVLHRQAATVRNFSQYEMVVTQWAFVGPALLWPDKLGILVASPETEEGMAGLVHVMYLVGRELGIREDLNMCSGDLAEVREAAREILVTEIQPVFLADGGLSVSRELATNLLAGVKILNPFINPEGFSKWCEMTLLERPEVDVKDMDTFSLTMFRLQLKVLALFHVPVLGPMLRLVANKLMRLNIFLATDWEQWIIQDQQRSRESEQDKVLAVLQALLIIPLMVLGSLAGAATKKILSHKYEAMMGISILAISVAIMNLL